MHYHSHRAMQLHELGYAVNLIRANWILKCIYWTSILIVGDLICAEMLIFLQVKSQEFT